MEKCEWVRKRTYHALSKEEMLEELSKVYLKMEEDLLDSTIKRYGVPYLHWAELHVEFSDAEIVELTDEQMLEYQVVPLSPGIRLGAALEGLQHNFEEVVPILANMLVGNRAKYTSMYSNEVIQIILQNEDEVFYEAETQLGTRLKEISRSEALPLPVLRDLVLELAKGLDIGLEVLEEILHPATVYDASLFCDCDVPTEESEWAFVISPCTA